MTEILILLIGVFAFIAISTTLQLIETHKKSLKLAEDLFDAEREIEHWEEAWEKMHDDYCELSKKHEPEMWFGCDTSIEKSWGDTDGFDVPWIDCDDPPEDWDE